MKDTQYTLAEKLKEYGFKQSSQPYQDAVEGNLVIVIVATQEGVSLCQRSYYTKLLTDKMPIKEARTGKIIFNSGGVLWIVTPGANSDGFRGLDREKTKYSIYR